MRASHETLAVSAACAACMRKSTEVVERAADCDAVQSKRCVRVRACTCARAHCGSCSSLGLLLLSSSSSHPQAFLTCEATTHKQILRVVSICCRACMGRQA